MVGVGYPIFPTQEVDTEYEADMSPTSPKDTQQMWSATPELFHDYLNILPSAPPEIIQYPQIAADDEREFRNSQDFLLDSQNQTAEHVQVSSKNSASNLFQVMKIVSDRQDLSFVEKVHIPEKQIVHLCNRIAPNAAENQSSDITIDFNSLNRLSLPTIGFYGDKGTMGGILKKMGVVDESIHTQMEEETFQAGLYVGLLKQFIVVFYWHQGIHLHDASRKDISCNLIRYVVDLCNDIYVCVEEHNLLEDLAANNVATTSHRPRRNQRLKISNIQNSKNDVLVSSGFRVNIGRYIISAPPPEGLAIVPKQTLFFAEGYHRCAFVTATYKQSGKRVNRSNKRVGVNELGSELEQLSKVYDLDFTKLCHDDFVSLLQHSGLPDSKRYTDLENSIKARREEIRNLYNTQYKLAVLRNQIMQNFFHVLPEYCSFIRYLTDSEESSKGNRFHQEIPIGISRFERLQRQLANFLVGNSGKQKLLFAGSEIIFHPANRGNVKRFIIKKSKKSQTTVHPILFEEKIKLLCTDEGGKKYKPSSFFTINKYGGKGGEGKFSSLIKFTETILSNNRNGGVENRHVASGEPLILEYGSGYTESGTLQVIRVSENVVREWIKLLVPNSLLNVQHNIVFLGFLLNNDMLDQMRSFCAPLISHKHSRSDGYQIEKELLLALLQSKVHLDQVNKGDIIVSKMKKFLVSGKLDTILQLIESGKQHSSKLPEPFQHWQKKISGYILDETLSSAIFGIATWKELCSSIYSEGAIECKQSVLNLMGKNMNWFQKRMEFEKAAAESLQEQQFKKERESFATETKEKLSQRRVLQRRMYIESCRIENANVRSKEQAAHLVFSNEEEAKPSIKWMIGELTPNKKDLEDLASNSMHCVTPSCPNNFELVCCEPEVEDLKKVALLRSGELLIFLHRKEHNALNLYLSPKPGSILHAIHKFSRGFDLVAFDESTRFLGLYDAQVFKVLIYRFDESFRHIYSTGIEIMLDLFSGSPKIIWMQCIPGKNELLLIDDTNRVRVVELHHHPLMKPKDITLSSHFFNACISGDGSFLFVFQTSVKFPDHKEESTSTPKSTPASDFELKVYILGDSMSFLKDIFLDINISDVSRDNFQVKLVCYGGQIHLVVYSNVMPHHISSNILKISSASEVLEFQEIEKHKSNSKKECNDAMDQDSKKTCATLDYIYHIFDKFAVDPVLCRGSPRDLSLHLLVKSSHTPEEDSGIKKCKEYLKLLIKRLEKEKGKDFSNLTIQLQVHMSESWHSFNGAVPFPSHPKKPLGNWIRQLVCLVPIQIAGAENNRLQPLLDGLQMPPELTYADSISLANLLRFGLYEAVLRQWDGKIKVVSSMGKQSSGKSYLLNHLSGSLLDVSGGRCTNGAWITIRMDSKCLYVLMDFEGLGSFERTEQEDMLLSLLNAALSNLTIFNKKDFHLDKDTEAIFQRFQSGVSLVKNDGKLFKGLFYIAIKDVDGSDVEDLKEEFREKLLQICKRSSENFLTKMYGGMVEISAMAPFTRQEYYQESLSEIASIIEDEQEELEHTYENGRVFLRDLKLVIAQIAAQDWTPIGSKRVAMKLDVLRRNMDSAVKEGSLSIPGANKMLIDFDTQDVIDDAPIQLGDLFIDPQELGDTGLELAAFNESISNDEIIDRLRLRLESFLERRGKNADLWHSKFQDFLGALVDRRCNRVQKWIHCNTAEFDESDDVHMLQLEADLALAKLKQGLSVCVCKCSICFWRCVQERNHSSDHNCMGNHVCVEKCTYCSIGLDQGVEVEQCQNFAGHGGNHDCKRKNHSCRGICSLLDKSSNCNQSCCLEIGHEGPHKCISLQHICKEKCSLPTCKNTCVQPIELRDHEKHACHERYCPKTCIMEDCPRSCGYEDHFHELSSDEHLCGNEHVCRNKCEADGICEIFTQLVRQKRLFQGRRGSFEYEHVSEQNGLRKDCCIPIPAFKRCHDGVHIHTLNPDAVHYCEVRCQACGYFCDRPIGHSGLHHTVHGNMRHTNFASDQEEIDIQGRKYTWGESGVAEMCNMHCKGQGRGHIHLIHCPMNGKCTSHIYDNGSRHETRKYGPDMNVPKDELTHETYWKQMRFEDPCTEEEDRKEFGLCNHLCRSEAHNKNDGSSSRSYCTEKLWHAPVENTSSIPPSAGHITADGHVFFCNHPENMPHHVVFVIDRSSSMSKSDIKPITTKFKDPHDCRLGCVYEGIVRFIATRRRTASDDSLSVVLFADTAILALEMQEMKEDLVDNLLQYGTQKGSRFSSGLEQAREVINYGSTHPYAANQKPTVIFFSDGDNTDGDDPVHYVRSLKEREPMMTLHTIMFGKNPAVAVLKEMAEIGSGSFQHSLDEIQLARSFEKIATSLKPGHIEALIPSRISTSTV